MGGIGGGYLLYERVPDELKKVKEAIQGNTCKHQLDIKSPFPV
jgi:hypothetical protein